MVDLTRSVTAMRADAEALDRLARQHEVSATRLREAAGTLDDQADGLRAAAAHMRTFTDLLSGGPPPLSLSGASSVSE